jgi:hypothetical protein
MQIDDFREKTEKSKNMLEIARRYAEEAMNLPENNERRKWLEEEASRFLVEAKNLTQQVKKKVSKPNWRS